MFQEKEIRGLSGWLVLLVLSAFLIGSVPMLIGAIGERTPLTIVLWLAGQIVAVVCLVGPTVVNPNGAKVVQLVGVYKGSIKTPGFLWVPPATTRPSGSLRVR